MVPGLGPAGKSTSHSDRATQLCEKTAALLDRLDLRSAEPLRRLTTNGQVSIGARVVARLNWKASAAKHGLEAVVAAFADVLADARAIPAVTDVPGLSALAVAWLAIGSRCAGYSAHRNAPPAAALIVGDDEETDRQRRNEDASERVGYLLRTLDPNDAESLLEPLRTAFAEVRRSLEILRSGTVSSLDPAAIAAAARDGLREEVAPKIEELKVAQAAVLGEIGTLKRNVEEQATGMTKLVAAVRSSDRKPAAPPTSGRQTGAVDRAIASITKAIEKDRFPFSTIAGVARSIPCDESTLRDNARFVEKWTHYDTLRRAAEAEKNDQAAERILDGEEHHEDGNAGEDDGWAGDDHGDSERRDPLRPPE